MTTFEIVTAVRTILGDENKDLVPSDYLLHLTANRIQRKWMTEYYVLRTSKETTMTTATEYALDGAILKLLKVECADSDDFEYSYDEKTNKITVINGLVSGVKFKIWYYVAPLTVIGKSVNPELGDDYRELFIEAIASAFAGGKVPGLRDADTINRDAEAMALKLRGKERYQPILFGELDF